jgi:hypothetical protein
MVVEALRQFRPAAGEAEAASRRKGTVGRTGRAMPMIPSPTQTKPHIR